jgi:hypothetical protein
MGTLNVAGMYRDLQNERSHPPPDHEIWYVFPEAFFHSLSICSSAPVTQSKHERQSTASPAAPPLELQST